MLGGEFFEKALNATFSAGSVSRSRLSADLWDDVIWSVSTQDGMQAGDLGRMAALAALLRCMRKS